MIPVQFDFNRKPYAEIVKHHREHLLEAADRIERGESLAGLSKEYIAMMLRYAASRIPDKEPKSRGHQPQINPGGAALYYVILRTTKGMNKTQAIAQLADEADVSVEAMTDGLKKAGADLLLRAMTDGTSK